MPPEIMPAKDTQTVTPDGRSVLPRIEGLSITPRPTIEDERGEICEMYSPAWGILPDPLVYAYMSSVRPGAIKGWIVHCKQEDRIFIVKGVLRWALYDSRPDSPTHGMVNSFVFSDRNRALFVIPRGVYHGVQNIGTEEAFFVNMPTAPYDHADPDKYRLPVENDLIPFNFRDGFTR